MLSQAECGSGMGSSLTTELLSASCKRADGTEDKDLWWTGEDSHTTGKLKSHQHTTVLEKREMLAVSRQLSNKTTMRMPLLGKLTAILMVCFYFFLNIWGSFSDRRHLSDMQNR